MATRLNLSGAIELVQSKGSDLERARLHSILSDREPPPSAMESIRASQQEGGGFAYWIKEFSSVCDTIYVLTWLDDLKIHSGDLVEPAFAFLLRHQRDDGSWDELPEVAQTNPPEFLLPGRLETCTWLTAYASHWFVRFGRAEPPGAKGCPVEFLLKHRERSGRIAGYLRATWDAGVPPDHPLVQRCLEELVRKQRDDGSWDSEDGEAHALDATIQALRVLKHYHFV